jgi:hypothetical protein
MRVNINEMMIQVLEQRGNMNYYKKLTNFELIIIKALYEWINCLIIFIQPNEKDATSDKFKNLQIEIKNLIRRFLNELFANEYIHLIRKDTQLCINIVQLIEYVELDKYLIAEITNEWPDIFETINNVAKNLLVKKSIHEKVVKQNKKFIEPIVSGLYKKPAKPAIIAYKQSLARFVKHTPAPKEIEKYYNSGKTIIPTNEEQRKGLIIYDKLNDMVKDIHIIATNAYTLLNYHIKRLLEQNVQDLNGFLFKNDIIERLINYITFKTDNRGKPAESEPAYMEDVKITKEKINKKFKFNERSRTNLSNCINSLALEMEKDINNHLKFTFECMFKRFLYIQNLNEAQINQVFNNQEYTGDNELIKKYNHVFRQTLNYKNDSNSLLVLLKLFYVIQQYFAKILKLNQEMKKEEKENEKLLAFLKNDELFELPKIEKKESKFHYKLFKLKNYIDKLAAHGNDKKKLKGDKSFKQISYKDYLEILKKENETLENKASIANEEEIQTIVDLARQLTTLTTSNTISSSQEQSSQESSNGESSKSSQEETDDEEIANDSENMTYELTKKDEAILLPYFNKNLNDDKKGKSTPKKRVVVDDEDDEYKEMVANNLCFLYQEDEDDNQTTETKDDGKQAASKKDEEKENKPNIVNHKRLRRAKHFNLLPFSSELQFKYITVGQQ